MYVLKYLKFENVISTTNKELLYYLGIFKISVGWILICKSFKLPSDTMNEAFIEFIE